MADQTASLAGGSLRRPSQPAPLPPTLGPRTRRVAALARARAAAALLPDEDADLRERLQALIGEVERRMASAAPQRR